MVIFPRMSMIPPSLQICWACSTPLMIISAEVYNLLLISKKPIFFNSYILPSLSCFRTKSSKALLLLSSYVLSFSICPQTSLSSLPHFPLPLNKRILIISTSWDDTKTPFLSTCIHSDWHGTLKWSKLNKGNSFSMFTSWRGRKYSHWSK